jgi:hypothetical protein
MSTLRIRPLRRTLWASTLITAASLVLCTWMLGRTLNRRSDEGAGSLSGALQLASVQETNRLMDVLATRADELDTILTSLLAEAPPVPLEGAPLSATHKLCEALPLPPGVTRMGVMGIAPTVPLAWLERGEKGCVDRLWSMQVQALTGPPFPAPDDVARLAQAGLFGMDHAEEGKTLLVGVYREGVLAHVRYSRGATGRVAFADFKLADLPPPPQVPGVRQDTFITVGGVVAGYVHGGPGVGTVPAAVKRIKAHEDRALLLPDVVEASASRAVMAWMDKTLWDAADLAVAGHAFTVSAALPFPIQLVTVSSTPWPAGTLRARLQLALLLVLAVTLHALALLVFNRRLARALWTNVNAVRAAWMVSHEDVELPDDNERAAQLVDTMARGTQETLRAAFGDGDRTWAPGPLERLLDLVRSKVKPTGKKP